VLTRKALKKGKRAKGVIELTRSGVEKLREIENLGVFRKAISIDDSRIKGIGENVYGTGLGLLDALLRLNVQLPGKRAYIIGFGRVGEGCATLLKKIGCEVEVFDRDAVRNVLASSMGFRVRELEEGLSMADIVVTATGAEGVINSSNVQFIRNGAIVCNMGAGEREIDLSGIDYERKDLGFVSRFSGRNYFYVVANGKPANLAVGNGTPLEVMDKTFALVVFALDYLVNNEFTGILSTPEEIELRVASLVKG
jgi:adenosylhomocysteinase